MSCSKSYLLDEIMRLLNEKNHQFPQEKKESYQQFPREPRYLIIPYGGVVDLNEKTKPPSMKRRNARKK